ncbi:DinB family protein [Streptomyces sp. BI20]|uniref:DinB family protein n=1 Tax=Streptomyces sp. BI20 TaxID=3403460 RepID=UPI003C75643E
MTEDTTVTPTVTRTPSPLTGDERETLTGMLQWQRDTLAWKCSGLTPEQLRTPAVAPSGLTLLGLVRHLAEVERGWFQETFVSRGTKARYPQDESGEWTEFHVADADPEEAFAYWRECCDRSREIVAAAPDLAAVGSHEGEEYSLRWILAHMIEEYARHNGHADLLREALDGSTGE